jgi:hypothetical protein
MSECRVGEDERDDAPPLMMILTMVVGVRETGVTPAMKSDSHVCRWPVFNGK